MPNLKVSPERRAWERLQAFQNLHESWRNFHTFKSDVGSRPSPHHQLRRRDKTKPHGPGNNVWLETVKSPTRNHSEAVQALAKAIQQTERSIWRKLSRGLTLTQIQQGHTRKHYVDMTDEGQRNRFEQKIAQLRSDLQALKDRTADLQDDLDKTLKLARAAELGDFNDPKPRLPSPKTDQPKAPEPIKYTAYDLKLKEEKKLAQAKMLGGKDLMF